MAKLLLYACDDMVFYIDSETLNTLRYSESTSGVISSIEMSDDDEHIVVASNLELCRPVGVFVYHNARSKSGRVAVDYNFTELDVSIYNNGKVISFRTRRSLYILDNKSKPHGIYNGSDYTVLRIVKVSGNG